MSPRYLPILLSMTLSSAAFAAPSDDVERIKAKFIKAIPTAVIDYVTESGVGNLYEVRLVNGPVVYASPDGSSFLGGDRFKVTDDGIVNLTEATQNISRLKTISAVPESEVVVFKAQGEEKAVVNVFTDTTCSYCRKLHSEMSEYNRLGITIRYLAFPRAGVGSEPYNTMVSVWCAEDQQSAMDSAKNGEIVPRKTCDLKDAVASQYYLGGKLGVRGTPSLITDKGKFVSGYQSPFQLAKSLGIDALSLTAAK